MAKLLIMEDDVAFAFQLKTDLISAGHEVEVRYSASEAIEELSARRYDLVVADIIIRDGGRPVPDGGIKLVSWIRRNATTRWIPIIVITGSHQHLGMEYILKTAQQIGANAGLEKPFNTEELFVLISSLTKISESKPDDLSRG